MARRGQANPSRVGDRGRVHTKLHGGKSIFLFACMRVLTFDESGLLAF